MRHSKIKALPEDFVVYEEVELPLGDTGPHRVYLMEKRSWNTVDAIKSIAEASGISPTMVRYAGLKDRHALTYQHVSVPSGVRLVSKNPSVKLRLLGFSHDFVSTRVLTGNAFTVTLRSLTATEQEAVSARVPEVRAFGFPNYYDDQRFGSVSEEGFFAERLLRGHLRGALKTHLTSQFPNDSPEGRARKTRIAASWGKWDEVRDLCVTAEDMAVAEALRKGGRRNDLLSGVNAIPAPQAAMYLSAYQGYLWNKVLGILLGPHFDDRAFTVSGKVGDYRFYRSLSVESLRRLLSLRIPTVARSLLPCDADVQEAIETVLAEIGIPLSAFGLRGVRNAYFHSFYRPAVVVPTDLSVSEVGRDEKYPGTGKVSLEFWLPPGSYATMAIKAVATSDTGLRDFQ